MTEARFSVSDEAVFERTISNIIDDNEEVIGAIVGSQGLVYEDETRRQVAGPVVVMVTDERIVFATEDERNVDAGTLTYGELASVAIEEGAVVFATTDGVNCVLGLGDDRVDDSFASHLRWIGEVRRRVIARQNDVELATEDIRDHAWAMEWEEGRERYETAREQLDELITAVQWTRPIPDHLLAPEVTPMERSLERAAASLAIVRGDSDLKLCRQLLESEEFEQVSSVIADARTYYDRGQSHLLAAERSDGFRFGEQRTLHEDLQELSAGIEKIRTRSLDLALRARERAGAETAPADSIPHLETALDRYRDAMAFSVEEREDLERDAVAVADSLIEQYREVARTDWNRGADLSETDDRKAAMEKWIDAVESLERALELAREFDHPDRDAIAAQLERVQSTLTSLREASDSAAEATSTEAETSSRETDTTCVDSNAGRDSLTSVVPEGETDSGHISTDGDTGHPEGSEESWRELTGSVAVSEPRETDE